MKTSILPQQNKIINTLSSSGVAFAAIFGSRAKGEARQDSDYDFLIEFEPKKKATLLDIVGVKHKLEDVLKSGVDLVTTGGINKLMKDEVYKTMKIVYDNREKK